VTRTPDCLRVVTITITLYQTQTIAEKLAQKLPKNMLQTVKNAEEFALESQI